jgi:hypothetical protein
LHQLGKEWKFVAEVNVAERVFGTSQSFTLASAAETGAPRFGPEAAAYEIKTSGGFSNDFRFNMGSAYPSLRELNFLQNSVGVHR